MAPREESYLEAHQHGLLASPAETISKNLAFPSSRVGGRGTLAPVTVMRDEGSGEHCSRAPPPCADPGGDREAEQEEPRSGGDRERGWGSFQMHLCEGGGHPRPLNALPVGLFLP